MCACMHILILPCDNFNDFPFFFLCVRKTESVCMHVWNEKKKGGGFICRCCTANKILLIIPLIRQQWCPGNRNDFVFDETQIKKLPVCSN